MNDSQSVPAQTPGPQGTQAQTPPEVSGALVLSGGGIKGAYQIGAMVEVIERGFRPTAIYGISIGSVNGGILASYVGEQIRAKQPVDFLAAAKRLEKYWHDHVTSFKKLGHKRCKLVILWEVITGNFKGLVTVDGVIKMIREEIKVDNLKAAAEYGLRFFAGTLNLSGGTYKDVEGIQDDIVEYIIASGMQPIVMPMARIPIEGSQPPSDDGWIDGGIHNVAAIGAPINEHYRNIICIVCRPDDLAAAPIPVKLTDLGDRLSDVVAQRLLDNDIAQALTINEWVDRIQANKEKMPLSPVENEFLNKFQRIDLHIIRPVDDLGVDMEKFERRDIEMMIERGHRDAAAEMQQRGPRKRDRNHRLGVRAFSTKPTAGEAASRWVSR